MVLTIAAAELRQHYREGILTVLAVLLLALLGITLTARVASFSSSESAKLDASRRVRQQWISQGIKHPHSGAHFGTYVFRQALPLEVLEPGTASFTGQIIPLVTHQRDFPIDMPIDSTTAFTRYGELSPGVIALALLSLFTILTGYGVVASDRHEGTLRLLLASGSSPGTILLGKFTGLALAVSVLWILKTILEAAAVWVSAFALTTGSTTGSIASSDIWVRFAGYQGVHLAYALFWVLATVAASAWILKPRVVLAVLLTFWIGNTILLPRVAATAVRLFLPEPTAEEFAQSIKHGITFNPDGSEWVGTWSKTLIADTLRRYGVKRIEDLPVGYAGVMLKQSDAHFEQVFNRNFAELHLLHERQQRWHHVLSFLGPWIAARSLLEGSVGSDLAHSARLSGAAEQYRRRFVESTNDAAENRGKGSGWEVEVGGSYWESIPDFTYTPPDAAWAVRQHLVSIGVLALWLTLACVLFYLGRFRLEYGS